MTHANEEQTSGLITFLERLVDWFVERQSPHHERGRIADEVSAHTIRDDLAWVNQAEVDLADDDLLRALMA